MFTGYATPCSDIGGVKQGRISGEHVLPVAIRARARTAAIIRAYAPQPRHGRV
jgi:hypothetical protein